jgi:phage shock protein PspC (stress-responsive transcriptional regulator)
MNEILNVNLGGYPFTIDNDAYHHINKYLKAIQSHFADSDGCDEILDDIEARMAELFTEFLNGKAIISMKELDAVIKVMGRPEDFGAESYDEEREEDFSSSKKSFKDRYSHIKTGKRFFRDPDEKIIAGVCGGIAAYFGIENPMWIRLGFLGLIFMAGIPIILYPILWVIVPEAKTSGDKLKMRGEPATVSNIARTVEEELNELSNKITEISKDLGSKKKNFESGFFSPGRIISKGISLIGKIVLGILNILKAILKPFLSFFLGIMLLVLGVFWAAWIILCLSSFPLLNYLGPTPLLFSAVGGLSIFCLVAIPILGLMLLITRWFSSYRIPQKWRSNLRLAWVASFVLALLTILATGMSFNDEADLSESIEYSNTEDVLHISAMEAPKYREVGIIDSPFSEFFSFTKDGLILKTVQLNVVKSNTNNIIVETRFHANGKSYNDAKELVNRIETDHSFEDNLFSIPMGIFINKGEKFRGQTAEYIIHIPEGKKVTFDKSITHKVWNRVKYRDGIQPTHVEKYTWEMTDKGLASLDWDKEYKAERVVEAESVENLNIDGRLSTIIEYGEKTEILLKGTKTAIDKVEKIETEGTTSLIAEGWIGNDVTLTIRTPKLSYLHTKDLISLKIEGFKQKDMELNISGQRYQTEIKAYVDVENLICNIGGANEILLLGSGSNLLVNILDGAKITAEHYKAENVTVKGNIHYNSSFYASESFDCPDDERHSITLYGNPELLSESRKTPQ